MSTPDSHTSPLDSLTLFFGDANPAEARLYIRCQPPPTDAHYQLQGRVVGPHCQYARTLTSTIPLVSQPGPALLAQALLPDPCFWTPREPYLYQVQVSLHRDGQSIAQFNQPFGIRRLGVHRGQLLLDGKNWNVRAVSHSALAQVDLPSFHDSATALLVDNPTDQLCGQASLLGVLLIARLTGTPAQITRNIHRIARCASVGLAILDVAEPFPADPHSLAPNLLLVHPHDQPPTPPWADLVLSAPPFHQTASTTPRLATRWTTPQPHVAAARTQCDQLQRDLAGQGPYVGYLV